MCKYNFSVIPYNELGPGESSQNITGYTLKGELLYLYMEIHVHSTLAMKEVGRKERQPRQTRHICNASTSCALGDCCMVNIYR